MQEQTDRSSLWLISATLSFIFTAAQIQSSLHSGSLSLPATYDDVSYFNDAMMRLEVAYREGGAALLKGLWVNPPHSPIQTLLVMTGFGLFGRYPWAADAITSVPLAIVLRLFFGFAVRFIPLSIAAVLAIALLGFPLFGILTLEIRPDALCAVLTAAGTLIITADPEWREGKPSKVLATSALFAGALLAKPTVSPVTVVVFGAAALAVLCLQALKLDDAKRIARIAIVAGGLGAVMCIPYYVAAFRHLFEYITVTMVGENAEVWRLNLSWRDHALYYLTGSGGKVSIGDAWLAMAFAIAAVGAVLYRRDQRTAATLAVVGTVAYLAVSVPATKSVFLGLIVSAFALCLTAMLSVLIISRLPHRLAAAATVGLVLFSLVVWQPIAIRYWGASVPAIQAKTYSRIMTQTADALSQVSDLGSKTLYMPLIAQYLNPENIEFELRRRDLVPPHNSIDYLKGDVVSHHAALDAAHLIVLFSDESSFPLPWVPSYKLRKEIEAMVTGAGSFQRIATIDTHPYPGEIIVLANIAK
ncbi:hypothetical protein CO683_00870 [Bradyrhizobium ottawaense]|uniref:hypothetical protein n=1 Tax=Bradyrhizobium ottawaense TaxID=931866 RepID=UPI000BE9EE4C|nr:hypothetical protein [Bradyrhizobium ottawaense]PDT71744.1 hypothetical protein CO683_00870 [Bradyrhizobium ottawaense]